jgi:hypothetical protein
MLSGFKSLKNNSSAHNPAEKENKPTYEQFRDCEDTGVLG